MTSKLSGPNIQMKVRQIVQESKENARSAMTGSRGHIHLLGELKAPAPNFRFTNESKRALTASEPPRPLLESEKKLLSHLTTVVRKAIPVGIFRQIQSVDFLDVAILDGSELRGFLLIGSSLEHLDAQAEAQRIFKDMGLLISQDKIFQVRLFGRVEIFIDDFPAWVGRRTRLVKRYAVKDGEVMACFVADPVPMPLYQPHAADARKMDVRLQDIPTNVPLPCAWEIFLPRNGKYVRMIRENGELSHAQQERLVKMGVSHLQLSVDDAERFGLFCVREKLVVV